MRPVEGHWLTLLLVLCFWSVGTDAFRVGVVNTSEPFVFVAPQLGTLTGYDVDLVTFVLGRLGDGNITFVPFNTVSELLVALSANSSSLDLAISALTITSERAKLFQFSQSYFTSGLQIMVNPQDRRSSFSRAIFSPVMQLLVCLFIIGLLLFAHCIWAAERWHNSSEFHKSYKDGIWDGIWWAAITAGTVGFGDKVPRSSVGKIVTIILMFWGMLMTALLVATVSSSLTASFFTDSIASVSDLNSKRVGIVQGRASGDYARSAIAAQFVTFPSLSAAIAALVAQRLDAVIDDSPMLLYAAANMRAGAVRVVGTVFNVQRYGIGLPFGSNITDALNLQLLRFEEEGQGDAVYKKWFSSSVDSGVDSGDDRTHVDPMVVFALSWTAVFLILGTAIGCASNIAYKQFTARPLPQNAAIMRVPLIEDELAAAEAAFVPIEDESYAQARRRVNQEAQNSRNAKIVRALAEAAPWERSQGELELESLGASEAVSVRAELAEMKAMLRTLLAERR